MQPADFSLHLTADGTSTLYSNEMHESYHSLNGAAQESMHVFIDAGLRKCIGKKLRIFEVGFGTGLNALLTWDEAKRRMLEVDYTTIEAFPLPWRVASNMHYEELELTIGKDAFSILHAAKWEELVDLDEGCFSLRKMVGDFTKIKPPKNIDLIYFDAFAPDKQPEMWEEHLFNQLFDSMNLNGILVTYCAKGEIRRRLQRSGFQVERIPGPPGKREMLRAIKAGL